MQNPLSAMAEEVATTRRVIDSMNGPAVAVGHSYAGGVIAQAAKGAVMGEESFVVAWEEGRAITRE